MAVTYSLTSPASQNGYGYVHGNPANFTDPTGKCLFLCVVLVGALLGGAIGGGAYVGYHGIDNAIHERAWNHGMSWEGFGMAVLEGAVLGAVGAGVGYGLGLASKAGWFIGQKGVAGLIAYAADVGAGAAWDHFVRQEDWGTAIASNALGEFLIGGITSGVGYHAKAGWGRLADTAIGRGIRRFGDSAVDSRLGRVVMRGIEGLDNFERGVWRRHQYAWSQTFGRQSLDNIGEFPAFNNPNADFAGLTYSGEMLAGLNVLRENAPNYYDLLRRRILTLVELDGPPLLGVVPGGVTPRGRITMPVSRRPNEVAITLYEEIFHTFQPRMRVWDAELEAWQATADWAMLHNLAPDGSPSFTYYKDYYNTGDVTKLHYWITERYNVTMNSPREYSLGFLHGR